MTEGGLALLVGGSLAFGAALGALYDWLFIIRPLRRVHREAQLKQEYLDKQLWQFVSLDEWLREERNG